MPTLKDRLELNYWLTADMKEHRAKLLQYVGVWALGAGWPRQFGDVLEVGTGPTGGILPLIKANRKVGVDPMHQIYCDLELLMPDKSVIYNAEYFEAMVFGANEKFDTIICADALDHGDLNFSIISRIWELLRPGGRFYLHVHLRPPDLINLIHDHGLTIEQLDKELSDHPLFTEVYRKVYEKDVDEKFCQAIVGVWEAV